MIDLPSSRIPARVRLAVSASLVCTLVAASAPGPAFAQTAPAGAASLEGVVVVGSREPDRGSRTTGDVVVLDRAAIRTSTADSLEELLRRAAGLQVVRNGGPGQSAGFFLRGAGTSGTLVLVDGVRIASPTLGQAQFESLSLAQVERIEVLRGPASSLYGADATGGVILVTTRRGQGPLRVDGSAAVGGARSFAADAGLSGATGAFDYALSSGGERSRGVSALRPNDAFGNFNPDADGYRRTFAQARLGWSPAAGHRLGGSIVRTRLDARYDAAEFAPPTFAPDPSPDFRNRLETTVATLDWRGTLTDAWTSSVLLGRHVDDARTGGNTVTRYVAKRWQATWQNALQLGPGHRLVLAYDRVVESVGGDVYSDGRSRHNDGFVVGWTGTFGPTSVQADLRRDINSVYGSDTTGRLGLVHAVGHGFGCAPSPARASARRPSTTSTFRATASPPCVRSAVAASSSASTGPAGRPSSRRRLGGTGCAT
jgi:vitamin B12 transporter